MPLFSALEAIVKMNARFQSVKGRLSRPPIDQNFWQLLYSPVREDCGQVSRASRN